MPPSVRMTAQDWIAWSAVEAAQAHRFAQALEILASLHGAEPRPPLSHYALFLCKQEAGEHEAACSSLFAFQSRLYLIHAQRLGIPRDEPIDTDLLADLLSDLNAPPSIRAEMAEGRMRRSQGDLAAAIQCIRAVIKWRVEALQALGFSVFPTRVEGGDQLDGPGLA